MIDCFCHFRAIEVGWIKSKPSRPSGSIRTGSIPTSMPWSRTDSSQRPTPSMSCPESISNSWPMAHSEEIFRAKVLTMLKEFHGWFLTMTVSLGLLVIWFVLVVYNEATEKFMVVK